MDNQKFKKELIERHPVKYLIVILSCFLICLIIASISVSGRFSFAFSYNGTVNNAVISLNLNRNGSFALYVFDQLDELEENIEGTFRLEEFPLNNYSLVLSGNPLNFRIAEISNRYRLDVGNDRLLSHGAIWWDSIWWALTVLLLIIIFVSLNRVILGLRSKSTTKTKRISELERKISELERKIDEMQSQNNNGNGN